MLFRDRTQAGQLLGAALGRYADRPGVTVLGLPRGGIPVAFEVAEALDAPLDLFLVRKLGVPGQEELAFGAIATGGFRVLNPEIVSGLSISRDTIDRVARKEQMELERRERLYRDDRPTPKLSGGRTLILVDDGIATGSSITAAVLALRQHLPARIIVAIPVAPASVCDGLEGKVDELVCLAQPTPFSAVGQWYERFPQVSDDEVRRLLAHAAARQLAVQGEQSPGSR